MKFETLVSSSRLLKAVRKLGWETPTPIQVMAIPMMSEGRDVVGIAQTGTGKTGAFVLPALERHIEDEDFQALILCPTRELAQQVAADAQDLGRYIDVDVVTVYGGVRIQPQITKLQRGWHVLVATPGRLIDHLQRGTVDLGGVGLLVLDEADRMLDLGFRPQIDRVLSAVPRDRQTFLLSATMPNGVHALALRIQRDAAWIEATPEATAAETVDHTVYSVRQEQKADLLLKLLAEPEMDQVLVFTRTKSGADVLFARLEREGITAKVLHGDRNMQQRQSALKAFSDGHVQVLVATDVAQRGLDIAGISHVVNFDVPKDPEDYIHRIGRTGRAGATGDAVTFMAGAELGLVHSIERVLGYKITRVSLPGYDYSGSSEADRKPATRSNRSGGRMGARTTDELSPEELKELLKLG